LADTEVDFVTIPQLLKDESSIAIHHISSPIVLKPDSNMYSGRVPSVTVLQDHSTIALGRLPSTSVPNPESINKAESTMLKHTENKEETNKLLQKLKTPTSETVKCGEPHDLEEHDDSIQTSLNKDLCRAKEMVEDDVSLL
jgi:hypothetical protein